MKTFSLSDLNRQSGEVVDAALAGAVELTKRGKRKLVLMNAETYDKLAVTRAYTLKSAPRDVHEELMEAVDSLLADK